MAIDNFWENRWQSGQTGWDLRGVHPLLPTLWEALLQLGFRPEGKRVLIPGCGHGYEAGFFADQGMKALGLDIAPSAISAAQRVHQNRPGVRFELADVLQPASHLKAEFDLVFDRAMLCALNPTLRSKYASSVSYVLRPGGFFISIPFTGVEVVSSPPYTLSIIELVQLFEPELSVAFAEEGYRDSQLGAIKEEALVILRKKEKIA